MIAAVSRRLESLLASAPEVLRALPRSSTEEVADGEKTFLLTVWRDKLDSGLDRIVVQAYERRSLGFGYLHAAGFTLSANGEKYVLTASDLYDFT
jgi:hypothetical protein